MVGVRRKERGKQGGRDTGWGGDTDRLVNVANLGENLWAASFVLTQAPRGAVDEVLVVGVCVCVCGGWVNTPEVVHK